MFYLWRQALHGYVGAKSAGMSAALVKRREWGDVMGADYVIESLSPILEVLR
jgi:hypothetical protein